MNKQKIEEMFDKEMHNFCEPLTKETKITGGLIKQFITKAIEDVLREVIGEDQDTGFSREAIGDNYGSGYQDAYEQTREAMKQKAKELGFNIE